jgi:peptide/nickel transport system substrate-binding protein
VAQSIKEGGTLVVATPSDILAADPLLAPDLSTYYVANQVIQGLVGLRPGTTSEIIPVLASALPQVSADGLTYTFKLRSGIKFHDGTAFNADAVKFNYDRMKNLPTELQGAHEYYYGNVFGGYGNASNLLSVEAPDEATVVFRFKRPQSNFLLSQTLVAFGIQSPAALRAGNADSRDPSKSRYYTGQGTGMVGTGPFIFREWVPADHVTLVKNPDYWDEKGRAHLDAIQFKPISDQTAALNALQAGDVDLLQTIAPNLIQTVKADASEHLTVRGQPCNTGVIGLNQKFAPLNNVHIRRAMSYALNRKAYVDTIYAGLGVVPDNWMPLSTQYAIPVGLPLYNPEKAKEEISASGLSGDQLKLDLWYPSDFSNSLFPDPKTIFEAIVRDLTAVGFKVEPHTASASTGGYFSEANSGHVPAWLHSWTCDWAGADNYLKAWMGGGYPSRRYGWSNPEVAAAVDGALAAANESEARALWEKAQRLIVQDMPSIPLIHAPTAGAARSYVKGYVPSGAFVEFFNTVWLDK